jgi:GT2 family glycosyltransferase
MTAVDVLIPTYRRSAALAVTLTSVMAQTWPQLRIVVSDQTEDADVADAPEVAAITRLLRARGTAVDVHKHLPRRGLAEQRHFLLEQARAPYVLYLDDDVICAPDLVERLVGCITTERCGFVGSALIGLSFDDDVRPHEQHVEFWDGPVEPERIERGTPAWERWRLHNAANIHHLAHRLELDPRQARPYKVAWVGGCVLYDVAALRAVGGFGFWRDLPSTHSGEDVLAQLRVMERFGGCGILPSGAYHQELSTTVPDRSNDAWKLLSV